MVLGYAAHAAPMQLVFYRGTLFPAEYQGDAFVTMRGSWNRKNASGYEIVRVRFQDGQAKDGALLMADDANGVIYRVAYTSNTQRAAAELHAPAGPMQQQASRGSGVPVAITRPQTQAQGKAAVSSSAFGRNGAIPARYSEYADGVSPPLSWTAVPNAKSYASRSMRWTRC
jgi:hypothetical protein